MPDDVLVKLPDGTFVRKPLSEVLRLSSTGTPSLAAAVRAPSNAQPPTRLEPISATPRTVFSGPAPLYDAGLESVAERVVGQCPIPSAEEGLARRLRSFVTLFLTGRVKARELEDFLLRSPKIGGVGLSADVAKTCLGVIVEASAKGPFTVLPKPLPSSAPSSAVSAPPLPLPLEPTTFAPLPSSPERLRPREAVPPLLARQVPVTASRAPGNTARPAVKAPPPPPTPSRKVVAPTPVDGGARPAVVDIRPPATRGASASSRSWWSGKTDGHLVGPSEEFNFTLEDFRRLADDPKARGELLKQKLEGIAKQDYAMRLTAVEYWKRSEVFRLYLEFGRAMLLRKLPAAELGKTLEQEGKRAITAAEFSAVASLNEWMGL